MKTWQLKIYFKKITYSLNIRTVQKWLVHLGFKYCTRRKNDYTTLQWQTWEWGKCCILSWFHDFIKKCFQYELCVHWWEQLPVSEYEIMCKRGDIFSGEGYTCNNENNIPYIEFHIDDNLSFSSRLDLHHFGGNLSVQKPADKKH